MIRSTFHFPRYIQREDEVQPFSVDDKIDFTNVLDPGNDKPEEPAETPEVDPITDSGVDTGEETPETPEGGVETPEKKEEPSEPTLSEEVVTAIEEQIKKSNPDASPDDLTKLVDSEKEKRLSTLKEENDLKTQILDKAKELKGLDENKDLTEAQIIEKAKEAVAGEIKAEDVFGDTDFSTDETSKEIDWTQVGGNVRVNGNPLTVEDNSPESFQAAIDNAIEEVKKGHEEYEELDPDLKRLVNMAQRDGFNALEKWINPDKWITDRLNYTPEQKVAEFLTTNAQEAGESMSEEELLAEISDMKEDVKNGVSEFDRVSRSLDRNLKAELVKAREGKLAMSEKKFVDRQKAEQQKMEVMKSAVHSAIDSMDKFVGAVEIPKNIKDQMKGKLSDAEIKKITSDPKFLANAVLFSNFGEKMFKASNEASFKKGRSMGLNISANIPLDEEKREVQDSSSKGASAKVEEVREKQGDLAGDWLQQMEGWK